MTRPDRPRGFFAIGIQHTKTEANVGTLMRHATLYGAAFVFTVGARYRRFAADTPNTAKHVPLFHFLTIEDLVEHLPHGAPLVGIEMDPRAQVLGESFAHPERACYLLGAEDHGLTNTALDACHHLVRIPTPGPASMNVAAAGTLLMHDRYMSRDHARSIAAFTVGSSR